MKAISKPFVVAPEASTAENERLFYPECGPMPYESIYSIYLKLSKLNCLKSSAMDGALRIVSEQQWTGHALTNWLESNVADIDSHLPWRYASCKHISPNTLEKLRFCNECIRFGYHSVFNNICTHSVCALHKRPLTKACLLCARGYFLGFRADRSSPQLMSKCYVCGFQCIDFIREIKMRHSPGLLDTLEEFGRRQAEWYESIFDVDVVYFNKYCHQDEQRDYLTGPLEALTNLKSPETLAGYPQDNQSFIFVGLDRAKDYRQSYPQEQVDICEQFEARHLGRHQNCLKLLNEMIRYPDGAAMTVNLCPTSLAYLIFRIKGIYGKWPIPGSSSINVTGMADLPPWGHVSDPILNYRSAFLFFLSILGRLQHHVSKGCNFVILCRPDQRYLIKGESERVIIKKASYFFRSMCRSPASRVRLFRDGVGGPILVMVEAGGGSFKGYSGIKRVIF